MSRSIRWMFVHKVLYEVYFYGALSIPFFVSKGYSVSAALTIASVYLGLAIALEVPSGVVADRFGHKRTMISGVTLTGLAMFGFLVFDNILWDLLCITTLAWGASLKSGSDIALLQEASDDFEKDNRTYEYIKQVLLLIGYGAAGFIVHFSDLDFAIFLTGLFAIAAAMPLVFVRSKEQTQSKEKMTYMRLFRTLPEAVKSVDAGWLIIAIIGLSGSLTAMSKQVASSLNSVVNLDIRWVGVIAGLFVFGRLIGTYLEKHMKLHDRDLLLATGLVSVASYAIDVSIAIGVAAFFVAVVISHIIFYRLKYQLTVLAPKTHTASLLSLANLARRGFHGLLLLLLSFFTGINLFGEFFLVIGTVLILVSLSPVVTKLDRAGASKA